MKRALFCLLVLPGCYGYGYGPGLRERRESEILGQMGQPAAAERAARRAAGLEETARIRAKQLHGWLWHDLAMD
jgi:hypothetical protein